MSILRNGFLTVHINAHQGGRIVSLSTAGVESCFYAPQETSSENGWINRGGDFLWIAPQDRWGWPPIPEFDSQPWDHAMDEKGLHLMSPSWRGLTLERHMDFEGLDTLVVENVLRNNSDQVQSWGLWNVSQIPLTFEAVKASVNLPIKIFDYPPNISQSDLITSGQIKLLSQKRSAVFSKSDLEITGKTGHDFKIGSTGDPFIMIEGKNYTLTKTFEGGNLSNESYPHGCSIEFYQCDYYLEAEIVWPMVTLSPGEVTSARQRFTLEIK